MRRVSDSICLTVVEDLTSVQKTKAHSPVPYVYGALLFINDTHLVIFSIVCEFERITLRWLLRRSHSGT